jgi:anti-sigma factor RsiW
MTCRDVSGLLPLFFDGELDARRMRSVALHSTRCPSCEDELRRFEQVQELVATTIQAQVDDIDLGRVWPAVEKALSTVRTPWWRRAWLWWEEAQPVGWLRVPALGATVAALIAFVVWSAGPSEEPQLAQGTAVIDNSATIDFLDSNADAIAVLNEPETNTTVLWVNDYADYGVEGFPP